MPNSLTRPTGTQIANAITSSQAGEVVTIGSFQASAIDTYISNNDGFSVIDLELSYIRQLVTDNGLDPDNLTDAKYNLIRPALWFYCAYQMVKMSLTQLSAASRDDEKWVQKYTLENRLKYLKAMGNEFMITAGILESKYVHRHYNDVQFQRVDKINDLNQDDYGKDD